MHTARLETVLGQLDEVRSSGFDESVHAQNVYTETEVRFIQPTAMHPMSYGDCASGASNFLSDQRSSDTKRGACRYTRVYQSFHRRPSS